MRRILAFLSLAVALLASSAVLAAERTVTLAVKNMYCAACPHIVRESLKAVPGVKSVAVSLQDKTAVVIYDDATTNVAALRNATAHAGYPSAPKS